MSATQTHRLQDLAMARAADMVAREIPRAIAEICWKEAARLGFRLVDHGNGFSWASLNPDRPWTGTAKTLLEATGEIYLVAGCVDAE